LHEEEHAILQDACWSSIQREVSNSHTSQTGVREGLKRNRKSLRRKIEMIFLSRKRKDTSEEIDRLHLRMCREGLRRSRKRRGDYVV